MKCIICNSGCNYYFTKEYNEPPFNLFFQSIGPVQYYKCTECGFVLSKTHADLDLDKWITLNNQFHHYLENPANSKQCNQPPYIEQATMLALLGKNGLIDVGNMLDYAAGYGTLSKLLSKYYSITLPIFDQYVQNEGSKGYVKPSELGTYRTVLNSAYFEHILHRADLDRVNNLVAQDGSLIIHTLVCENVPNDPNWFYLWPPVHTAFHTNKSMRILMEQWGYLSSIYCPQSKCWVLLKRNDCTIEEKVHSMNQELQTTWFFFKKGFTDFWKGF